MAYDPAIGKLVLFGGAVSSPNPFLDETWTYDGESWTRQYPATSPPARWAPAAMAYDPGIRKLVLYGGERRGGSLNDTWTYDGATWTQQHPATSPALGMASMAYDPDIGKLVLFGFPQPFTSSSQFETWTYNGTTWTRESPAGPIPARYGGTTIPIVYDAALRKIVLYASANGETWTYDGTAWTKQPTAPISNLTCCMAMAYDPAIGQTVLFGGMSLDPNSRSGQGPPLNDTWTYNGTNWTKQSPSAAPPPRYKAAMAFDPTLSSLVLFGGESEGGGLADTWTYSPAHRQ
jgi:hypothetical protein